MKKLIALLLALMMALVCVSALADDPVVPTGDDPEVTEPSGEPSGDDTQNDNNGTTTTPTTPAATTAATDADPSVDTGYDPVDAPTTGLPATSALDVTVSKHFNVTGSGAKVPPQSVEFEVGTGTVTNSSTISSAPPVTMECQDFAEGDETKIITIHLPAYSGVGVYTYPVTETDTNIAGVSYASNLELKVTVIQGKLNGADALVIAGIALRQNNVKTDTLENDYAANALTVGKTVDGNNGDRDKLFPITVVLTAPTGDKVTGTVGVTITGDTAEVKDGTSPITTTIAAVSGGWTSKTLSLKLKHGQTVKFDNLPAGVTYTVVEDSDIVHLDAANKEQDNTEAYLVEDEVKTATALTADKTVTIKNTKNIDVDTGVTLDSTVYMLIMALALAGFVVLKIRRREDY